MTMQELHNEMVVDPSWQVSLEFTEEDATNNGIEEVFRFDKDLMQYMISLPVEQKLHNGRSRYHFRNAMKDTVPSSILNRFSKANLSKCGLNMQEIYQKKLCMKYYYQINTH